MQPKWNASRQAGCKQAATADSYVEQAHSKLTGHTHGRPDLELKMWPIAMPWLTAATYEVEVPQGCGKMLQVLCFPRCCPISRWH